MIITKAITTYTINKQDNEMKIKKYLLFLTNNNNNNNNNKIKQRHQKARFDSNNNNKEEGVLDPFFYSFFVIFLDLSIYICFYMLEFHE